jgi:hypothetical protein
VTDLAVRPSNYSAMYQKALMVLIERAGGSVEITQVEAEAVVAKRLVFDAEGSKVILKVVDSD